MLEREEISRRIKAARELRGLSQRDLGRLLEADGLGLEDVGRIERCTMAMSRVQREAIQRHLGIPERWLTAESIDEIVGLNDSHPPRSDPESLEGLVDLLHETATLAERVMSRQGRDIGRRDLEERRARDRRLEVLEPARTGTS